MTRPPEVVEARNRADAAWSRVTNATGLTTARHLVQEAQKLEAQAIRLENMMLGQVEAA